MTFIEQFESELNKKLLSNETAEAIIRWASERVLASYRNGITAGQNGTTVKRKGQSRRKSTYPERAQ